MDSESLKMLKIKIDELHSLFQDLESIQNFTNIIKQSPPALADCTLSVTDRSTNIPNSAVAVFTLNHNASRLITIAHSVQEDIENRIDRLVSELRGDK